MNFFGFYGRGVNNSTVNAYNSRDMAMSNMGYKSIIANPNKTTPPYLSSNTQEENKDMTKTEVFDPNEVIMPKMEVKGAKDFPTWSHSGY